MNETLITKYLNGKTSADENMQVMKWIEASPENLKEFKAYRKLHDLETWNPQAIMVSQPKKRKIAPLFMELTKIAAVVLITVFGIQFLQESGEKEKWQTVVSPMGQRTEIFLADGTKVWLNSQSKLTYPTSFQRKDRKVKIEGEAYFMVAHDASHPFIVNTKNYDIKVLGTEFNVYAYPQNDYFNTSLVKGEVNITSEKTGEHIHLSPNMQAITHDGKLEVSEIKSDARFLWREGIISFNDNSIEELAKKLQLYFDVNIVIHRKDNHRLRYTGKFRVHDGVHHILRTLELRKEFVYTYDGITNTVTIL